MAPGSFNVYPMTVLVCKKKGGISAKLVFKKQNFQQNLTSQLQLFCKTLFSRLAKVIYLSYFGGNKYALLRFYILIKESLTIFLPFVFYVERSDGLVVFLNLGFDSLNLLVTHKLGTLGMEDIFEMQTSHIEMEYMWRIFVNVVLCNDTEVDQCTELP